jgi:hypothetical protein
MKHRLLASAAWVLTAAALVAWTVGCSPDEGGARRPNVRPSVTLTQAPIDTSQIDPGTGQPLQYFYAYRLQWSGFDPDGKVDYYLYAVDPPNALQAAAGADTDWVRTTRNEQIVFFSATRRDPFAPSARPTSSDFHTFVIKAVDNAGDAALQSEPVARQFFSYTVAPTVRITNPVPNEFVQPQVSPSVRVTWTGTDPDGQFSQKPVRYKYRLYSDATDRETINLAAVNPDAFRDSVVFSGFAGYDSSSADTTFATFSNLTPSVGNTVNRYLFVVVGFDEAGAYSPLFNLSSSMLLFTAGYANALGPKFTIFNEYLNYTYTAGGYSRPGNPLDRKVIRLQVPADRPITFNWFAEPSAGANIAWYRWVLDLNLLGSLDDETPRSDEDTDWYHWSAKSNSTTSCTIGPFGPGDHWMWIEAEDNNGVRGNAVIFLTVVRPTFERDLLVVDDTRFEVDQRQPAPRDTLVKLPYFNAWPSAAELDTFFYARGNTRWRGLPSPQPVTPPGVFAGYNFDTLGTRLGLEDVAQTVTLSRLAPYRHVLWMVDAEGAANIGAGTDRAKPICSLRFFARGAANPLAAFIESGGQAWLTGGGIGMASTLPWARGNTGATPFGREFSALANRELAPGRFMYDISGWQVEFIAPYPVRTNFLKYQGPVAPYPGAPNRAMLPDQVFIRDDINSPTLPPTRSDISGPYYPPGGNVVAEYISDRTFVLETSGGVESASLDTLMHIQGGQLRTQYPQNPDWVTPVMTLYRPARRGGHDPGVGGIRGSVIMSGFAPWDLTRADCISLVDFVLQGFWGLTRAPIDRGSPFVVTGAARSAAPPSAAVPARRAVQGRLPIGRNRE